MTETTFRSQIEELLSAATSRSAFSFPVIALSTLISVILHLVSSPDLGTDRILLRAFIAAAAMQPLFILLWLTHQRNFQRISTRIKWIIVTYMFGGFLRGLIISEYIESYSFRSSGSYRIPASVFIMTLTVVLISSLREAIVKRRQFIEDLHAENAKLQAALEQIKLVGTVELRTETSVLISTIVQELEAIQNRPMGEQADAISELVQSQIRPMSHRFAEELNRWSPSVDAEATRKQRTIWIPKGDSRILPHWWAAIPAGLAPVPVAFHYLGIATTLPVVIMITIFIAAILQITRFIFSKIETRQKFQLQGWLLTFLFIVQGVITALAANSLLRNTAQPALFQNAALIGLPIYFALVTSVTKFLSDAKERAVRLIQLRDELNWAIARIELVSWFRRGVISRLLHGPIQNALLSLGIRTRLGITRDGLDDLVRQLRLEVHQSEERRDQRGEVTGNLISELTVVQELWKGVADVSVSLTPRTVEQLSSDQPLSAILADLCMEQVSNAIRHGHATQLKIEVEVASHTAILRIVDNGSELKSVGRGGLGTRMLDSCSIRWSRTRDEFLTKVEAVLPLSNLKSVSNL